MTFQVANLQNANDKIRGKLCTKVEEVNDEIEQEIKTMS